MPLKAIIDASEIRQKQLKLGSETPSNGRVFFYIQMVQDFIH